MPIRTFAGKFVQSIALRDIDRMRVAETELIAAGLDGMMAVLWRSFRTAVRIRFPDEFDIRNITSWTIDLEARPNPTAIPPRIEIEALIRNALGERNDVSDISSSVLTRACSLVVSVISSELNWDPEMIDEVVSNAEEAAIRSGVKLKKIPQS